MVADLENNWSDQSLDLGWDALGLLALLDGEWALDDVLPDIILLGQIEQFADLGGTLGSQALGDGDISKAGDLSFTLLHNDQSKDRQVGVNNAATHRLALPLASSPFPVARVALAEQQAHTAWTQTNVMLKANLEH